MRILQVLPKLEQGGVERGTLEIASALNKAGIENYVASSGGKMLDELTRLGTGHIQLPLRTKNPFKMWQNSKKLEKIIQEYGIDLVHVRSRAPAHSVKWACNRLNVPFVTTFHGMYGLKPKWLKKPYNRVMVSGQKVIAVSEFIKQHICQKYQVPEDKICLIPRGADANLFNQKNISDEALANFVKTNGISTKKFVITLVGRLSRIKGHDLVLDAISKMENQNITLLFVGGNAKTGYDDEMQQKLDRLPKNVSVKMISVSPFEMPFIYAISDVCVQSTIKPESFGRTVVESQMMGCIPVAFAHGGALETIIDGTTGFLTPVSDVDALAKTLDKVIDLSEEERAIIGLTAQKSAREKYSIDKMQQATLNVYKQVLS